MSFILSGSFHHLRNCRIGCANISLLRCYSRKSLLGLCKIRPLTTRAEATRKQSRNGTPESINLNISKTEILKPHIEPIQCYASPLKEANLEAKIDRPATILVFDLETTGFNSPAERIIEFAARNLMGGRNSTFQTLINPKKHIKNSHVHGITNLMVNQPGVPRFEDACPIILEWVRRTQEPGKPVIWLAHNGKTFDFPFLLREMDRCGCEAPDDWRFFDTLALTRRLVDSNGVELKRHKVPDLCEFFGIIIDEPLHRAVGDVNKLSYIFQHTTHRLKFPVSSVLEESISASEIKWKPSK
jgi:DNA polymerase III epsilon subunit-like protein